MAQTMEREKGNHPESMHPTKDSKDAVVIFANNIVKQSAEDGMWNALAHGNAEVVFQFERFLKRK